MQGARLIGGLRDWAGVRLHRALLFSLALHLGLVMLVQPAPRGGAETVVLQARIVPAAEETVASHASGEDTARVEPPEPPGVAVVADAQPTQSPPPAIPDGPPPSASPLPASPITAVQSAPGDQAGEGGQAGTGVRESSGLPDIPVMLDTRWYTAREVDATPRPVQPIQPQYPEQARIQGIQGYVVLQLRIDQFGVVQDIEVQESNPPGVFDQSSLEAFRQARFHPAQRDGYAVRALVKIRVTFELY